MSPSTNQKKPWFARKIAFVAIACLSLYLPSLAASGAIKFAFAGLGTNASLVEYKIFGMNCIQDGQAWFISSQRKENAATFEYSIKRIDLKTGVIHQADIPKTDQNRSVFVVGSKLYLIKDRSIYQIVDNQLTQTPIGIYPPPQEKPISGFFQFQGKLTIACQLNDGELRLTHLIDGEWVEGQEIRIPTFREIWNDESEFIQPGFAQPLPDADTSIRYEPSITLNVLEDGQGDILFLTSNWRVHPTFGAFKTRHLFRRGFQFVEEREDVASALKPGNTAGEATGWEPTTTIMPNGKQTRLDVSIQSIACDAYGPIVSFSTPSNAGFLETHRLSRRGADGQLRDLSGLNSGVRCQTVVDPSDGTAYLIEESADHWNSVAFRRIDDSTIQPAFLSIGNGAGAYIARWRYVLAGLLGAWILHYLILIGASACLAIDKPDSKYECDMHTAVIAPIWKRVGTATIDLLGFIATVFAVWYVLMVATGVHWTTAEELRLADLLYIVHRLFIEFLGMSERMELTIDYQLEQQITNLTQSLSLQAGFYASWIGLILVVCGIQKGIEAYSGITLGKWVLGTRTTNSNLNRPGLFSAFVRAFLCPIDFFLLLTPIPAIGFMWLSNRHRRLGDHCADTIVINVGSIRTEDWYRETVESQ